MNELAKRWPLLTRALVILVALALVLLVLKLAFTYLLPFVFAFLIAAAMEPPIRFLEKRRVPRVAAVAAAMLVYFGLALTLGFLAVTRLVTEVVELSKNIPDYFRTFTSMFDSLARWGERIYRQLPKEAAGALQDSVQSLGGQLTKLLTSLAGSLIGVLTSLPDVLLFVMFTIIATFFTSRDLHVFSERLAGRMPAVTFARLSSLKESLGRTLLGFLKAQMLLMAMTFAQCFLGLSLIGIRYAFVISIFIAIVDILPVLGTGTVLVPWGVVALLLGKTTTGVALLGLYLLVMVVRYIVEPKIVGDKLGLHPLLALMAMFAGLMALGVAGLILGPAIFVAVQALLKSGLLPGFREQE